MEETLTIHRLLMPALLAVALFALVAAVRVRPSQLGFRPWRDWTTTEKSYFCQIVVLANGLFSILLAARLRTRIAHEGMLVSVTTVFVPYLVYGFYQELVYRGMLQSELVRRWGTAAGILAANVVFTFGPLHWYYFASRSSVAIPMFAAIFAIGLFFGALYKRSGNLWIVAVFHAIGNAYIVWGAGGELSGH